MHTARSRNDILSTMTRLNVRDAVLPMYEKFLLARYLLLDLAEKNKGIVLTGYTHMQPAQPISLTYYLLAIGQAMQRDFARWLAAYERLNLSALGGAAFAGTSFPIDRHYVAKLLSCDAPLENNMDAVVARDYLLEYTAAFATLGITISRFATDLYYWATDEFGYVEVDDSIAVCSSIMPQKKNPVTLEHLRTKPAHLMAAFVSIFGTLKGIAYGHCRDGGGESHHMFWDASAEMDAILELLNVTLKNMKFKAAGAKERADENFSTVTELADAIVKEEGISFREAHEIVGHVVGVCIDRNLRATGIDSEMLDEASVIYISRKLQWTDEHIREVLDANTSVNGKNDYGGPAPEQCDKMLANQLAQLKKDEARFLEIKHAIIDGKAYLEKEISDVIG